jgi:hypothetical protein
MDTLEHIAPPDRPTLLDELFRAVCSGGTVIVGAPCGEAARTAEQAIAARYQQRTGRPHPWLAEHLLYPPMTPFSLRALVAEAAARRFDRFELQMVANTSLRLWQALQDLAALRHLHRILFRPCWLYLRQLHDPPAYRQVCIVRDAGAMTENGY